MALVDDDVRSAALRAYYAAMDRGDYEGAAAVFAPDAVYVRPEKVGAVPAGQPKARQLAVLRGRDAIAAFVRRQAELAEARGAVTTHRVDSIVVAGDRCFVEGVVPSPDGGPDVVFFAHATVGPDGLVTRYAALSNEAPD